MTVWPSPSGGDLHFSKTSSSRVIDIDLQLDACACKDVSLCGGTESVSTFADRVLRSNAAFDFVHC
jgi:hypothetical protein